jgi:hypothetical protein
MLSTTTNDMLSNFSVSTLSHYQCNARKLTFPKKPAPTLPFIPHPSFSERYSKQTYPRKKTFFHNYLMMIPGIVGFFSFRFANPKLWARGQHKEIRKQPGTVHRGVERQTQNN